MRRNSSIEVHEEDETEQDPNVVVKRAWRKFQRLY